MPEPDEWISPIGADAAAAAEARAAASPEYRAERDRLRALGPLAGLQPMIEGLRDQVVPGAGVYAGGADVTGGEGFVVGIDAAGREYALRFTIPEFERWIGQLQMLLALMKAAPAEVKAEKPWLRPVVDWWVNELTVQHSPTLTGTHDLAEIGLSAKDRESIVWPDEGQLLIFRGYLMALIQDRNLHQADLVLKTDYDPLGELWEAASKAKIDPRCFPQKTIMRVSEHYAVVAKGYGAPFETFWTDPLWHAAQRGPEYP